MHLLQKTMLKPALKTTSYLIKLLLLEFVTYPTQNLKVQLISNSSIFLIINGIKTNLNLLLCNVKGMIFNLTENRFSIFR